MKRFIVEVGMGVDQHGQDHTRAAEKAVQDAIHRSCLCGLREVAGLKSLRDVVVEVIIGCPSPESVDRERVLKVLPLGQKKSKSGRAASSARRYACPSSGIKRMN